MRPSNAIGMLDAQLSDFGQTVSLRRGPAASPVVTATVKGFVRGYKADEIVSGIVQGDSEVVLSPTGLATYTNGPQIGDVITINGRARRVEAVEAVILGDVPVRYNLQVRG
jgi:hypothetical protein